MVETIKQLVKFHTSRPSALSRDAKDAIMHCIFCLFDESRGKELSETEWSKCICVEETPLYCWTKDQLEKLKKTKEPVYLCTSLSEKAYNEGCAVLSKPYHYQYRIYLQENTYGILLNTFGSTHPNEMECLIKLSDVERYDRIN